MFELRLKRPLYFIKQIIQGFSPVCVVRQLIRIMSSMERSLMVVKTT